MKRLMTFRLKTDVRFTLLVIALAFISGCQRSTISANSQPSKNQIDQLIAELNPESVIVALPKELRSHSITNEAYVTRSNNMQQVLFIHWMGKGRNMMGSLFSSTPLTTASEIEINSIDFALGQKRTCKIYADVSKAIGNGWYEVSYSMD